MTRSGGRLDGWEVVSRQLLAHQLLELGERHRALVPALRASARQRSSACPPSSCPAGLPEGQRMVAQRRDPSRVAPQG